MDCQKQLLCHLDPMVNSDEDLVEKFKYVNAIYAYVNFHVKFSVISILGIIYQVLTVGSISYVELRIMLHVILFSPQRLFKQQYLVTVYLL